jgi:hypothetical protein
MPCDSANLHRLIELLAHRHVRPYVPLSIHMLNKNLMSINLDNGRMHLLLGLKLVQRNKNLLATRLLTGKLTSLHLSLII